MERVTPLIEARNLSIGHGRHALIQGINLRLQRGQILCLLGPNGAGKTTLFRSMLGLIPAIFGQIELAGQPLVQLSRVQIAERVAHVPQALATSFSFTALDIVLMGAAARLGPFARPGPAETTHAMAAMDRLGITDLAWSDVMRLSGGQRQLVLIARAIAQNAEAIIMDEPTASLDFANRIIVDNAIRQLADLGTGVILSSHDPDQAASLGDEAVLLNQTGLIASGPVSEVLTADNLTRLYGVPVSCQKAQGGRLTFF